MKNEDLDYFKKWFEGYCGSYIIENVGAAAAENVGAAAAENVGADGAGAGAAASEAAEDRKNYSMKREHTVRVMENAALIAQKHPPGAGVRNPTDAGVGSPTDEGVGNPIDAGVGNPAAENYVLIARAAGLFHDVGRFPQYAKYKTFRDAVSVNHGVLGAETLVENAVMTRLPRDEQDVILHAVKYHNAFRIPAAQHRPDPVFLKIVRDADKLDIWRVFTEMFDMPSADWPSAATLDLPDTDSYTPDVLECVLGKRPVAHAKVRCVNDFKLIQLSWIFDLNFKTSFELLGQRNYMTLLAARLPRTDGVLKLQEMLQNFIAEKLYRGKPEIAENLKS